MDEEIVRDGDAKQFDARYIRQSLFPKIGLLAKPEHTFPPDQTIESIHKLLGADQSISAFTIIDGGSAVLGFMTRTALSELLSGRYGYWLHNKKIIRDAMKTEFLRVDYEIPIDAAARLAMQRSAERLYDPIVVEKDGKYAGIVTIKDLLEAHSVVELETAVNVNPLTKLPGNIVIEKEIQNRLLRDAPYCIIYIDIDNFKAYNDTYGFENGDVMLRLVADILKERAANGEFIGHIGGDDFIIACDYHDGDVLCGAILERFAEKVRSLYRDEDLENNCITSINRHGVIEKFPIASLSVAGITNKENSYTCLDEFSKAVAQLKKKCKRHVGNYFKVV